MSVFPERGVWVQWKSPSKNIWIFRMESEQLIYTPNPRSKENDLENDFNYGNNVISASAEVRKGFLRKVYGILTVQLLMTCGVSGIFGF